MGKEEDKGSGFGGVGGEGLVHLRVGQLKDALGADRVLVDAKKRFHGHARVGVVEGRVVEGAGDAARGFPAEGGVDLREGERRGEGERERGGRKGL